MTKTDRCLEMREKGFPYKDIANELGISVVCVGVLISQRKAREARKALKAMAGSDAWWKARGY